MFATTTVSEFPTERLLARLALAAPLVPDLTWLAAAYRAWCRTVPFSNLGKLKALRNGQPLPSLDASAIASQFLEDGTCGTCFAHAVTFSTLLNRIGYDVQNYAGHATGEDGARGEHATTVVCIDGQLWLVDTALPHGAPLPLHRDRPSQISGVMTPMTVTPHGDLWQLDFVILHNNSRRRARLVEALRDAAHVEAAFLRTLEDKTNPFNLVPIVRLEVDDGSLTLANRKLFRVFNHGEVSVERAGPEALSRFGVRPQAYEALWEQRPDSAHGSPAFSDSACKA